MRVLHVQKASGIGDKPSGLGGSERHLLSLLPGLAEAGAEVRVCAPVSGPTPEFVARLRALGVPHSVLRAGPDFNPLLVERLRREIRRFRPDLVHTHLIHADFHGQLAARLGGVPGVSSVHGTHGFYRREPYRGAARIAGHSARLTIAISAHVGRFIEELRLTPRGAVRVIHYGIEADSWSVSEAERASARTDLGIEPGDVAVGVASRLVADKGHDLLLRAHANASRRAPQLRLLVAGDGALRADLEREAAGLEGRVDFLGFISDIRSFMIACDVFAFPTQPGFGEGFGLAALEAMAAGRPVVATAIDSLPEIVSGEETGFLVDPGDEAELAAALVRLADDAELRETMGLRGSQRARVDFSLDSMVERTMATYEEARRPISRHGGHHRTTR